MSLVMQQQHCAGRQDTAASGLGQGQKRVMEMETVVSNGQDTKQLKQYNSPHLKKVLRSYQLTAQRSLKGPAGVDSKVEVKAGGSSPPPPPPTQQPPPVFYTQDRPHSSELLEATLRGSRISCFNVGGELRLCLPQVIKLVLPGVQAASIQARCDELQIHCSRSSAEQLDVLKRDNKLPDAATSCGLITQTDAERLSGALLGPQSLPGKLSPDSAIKIYHECFGVSYGLLSPSHFENDDSECIECRDCSLLFSPQGFVTHVHNDPENCTCHWGFDSAKWRNYIQLDEDQPNYHHLKNLLQQLKQRPVTKYKSPKRKQYEDQLKIEPQMMAFVNGKRQRLHYEGYMLPAEPPPQMYPSGPPPYSFHDPITNYYMHHDFLNRIPLPYRSWPLAPINKDYAFKLQRDQITYSLLNHAPPILTNPSRVVPFSESDRFESQPNVALAPLSQSSQRSSTQAKSSSLGKEPKEDAQRPSSTTAPVHPYNSEIEVSTDTNDSDSATATTVVASVDEETKLLNSLARCVAGADDDARRLGEHALQMLREVMAATRAENQMLREKLEEVECRMTEERAQHEKEIVAMSLQRLGSPREHVVIQHAHAMQNGSAQRTSPTTSVITSSSAIVKKEPLTVD